MNSCAFVGRLTSDPIIRYSPESQMCVASFTLAIDDGYGEKKTTDFIPVVCFGKTAESVEKYLSKGKMCGVTGRVKTGSYLNKQNVKTYTTEIYASNVEFLSPRDENYEQPTKRPVAPPKVEESQISGFMAIEDDDLIPF